jgi:AcrR family transcriptional regulator
VRAVPDDIARRLMAGADRLTVGFEDVRMDDLAQASGIPRATLYYHFPSRQDVLTFLYDTMLAEYRRTVRDDGTGTARERLTRLLDRLLDQVTSHPGTAQITVANLGELGKLTEMATIDGDPLIREIEGILRDGVERGEVRPIEVRPTAVVMSTMANTVVTRALVAGELDQRRGISEWLVGLFWDGVAAPDATIDLADPADEVDPAEVTG